MSNGAASAGVPASSCIPSSDEDVIQRLFPGLQGTWKKVDLSAIFAATKAQRPISTSLKMQSKLLRLAEKQDPTTTTTAANTTTTTSNELPVYSYGGFGEDRDKLWFGTGAPSIHLGVDFNSLPEGQPVHALTSGTVIHVMRDTDTYNGWGGRVIIHEHGTDLFVLYGHLCHHRDLPALGASIQRGDCVGRIAGPSENGGWICHLHLQCMTRAYITPLRRDLDAVDGYAAEVLPPGIIDPMTL